MYDTLKTIAVVQARMNSKRLPGKVMLNIIGKPLVWHIYNRLKKSKLVSDVVVSTGDSENNELLCKFLENNNIPHFFGDETDLIDRLYQTAKRFNADIIVRITGDCPLADPKIIDNLISTFIDSSEQYDIVINNEKHTFPHGLDVEVYSFKILEKLWNEIKNPEFREWFTLYFKKNNSNYNVLNIESPENLSSYRWTVDYPEDFEFVKTIYENIYTTNPNFLMDDIIKLLKEKPELLKINSKYNGFHNIDAPKI
jgi:spore coat polysaccharide biosynthesis protein SpsF